MFAVSNYELFEELFTQIQEGAKIEDVLKEHGGSSIYIPSFKTIFRDDEIRKKYLELQELKTKRIAHYLAKEYELSVPQIYSITKEIRQKGEL